MSLHSRMGLLFLAFFLLVGISVAATFWIVDTQKQDALVINLAGRQRMLIQQMSRDALAIKNGQDRGADLRTSAWVFDQTLQALIEGGEAPYLGDRTVELPATRNADVLVQLHRVREIWEALRAQLSVIATSELAGPDTSTDASAGFDAAMPAVERLSPHLLQQTDEVLRAFETASTRKIDRLRWVQVTFFVSALVLLGIGFLVTRRSALEPLRRLGSVAERIGVGDLDTPVEVTGPREIELLARRLDTMRGQLQTSQAELRACPKIT